MLHTIIYVVSIISLSQSSVLIKLSQVPPDALGFWRLLGASLVLLGFRLALGNSLTDTLRNIKNNARWVMLTGVFFFLHLWSYSYSAQNTSIAHCMILFALNPLFTAIGAKIAFNEPLEKNVAISYLFAFAGLYFLLQSRLNLGTDTWKGEVCALVSGLLYSIYTLFSKHSRSQMNNWNFSVGVYFVGALCFFATTLTLDTPLTGYSSTGWISIVGTIIIPTFLGHALFTYLMNYLNINWMSCGKLLEPTLSAFVAFLVFHETITLNTVFAFALTTTAVLFLFFRWEIKDNKIKILLRNK